MKQIPKAQDSWGTSETSSIITKGEEDQTLNMTKTLASKQIPQII